MGDLTGEETLIPIAYGVVVVLGFIAGLLRGRFRQGPYVATAAVVVGYLAVVALSAGWYAACTSCASHISYDSAREIDFWMAIWGGGLFAAGAIMFVWLGAGVAFVLRPLGKR